MHNTDLVKGIHQENVAATFNDITISYGNGLHFLFRTAKHRGREEQFKKKKARSREELTTMRADCVEEGGTGKEMRSSLPRSRPR
jgi:hypothetical protein